MGAGASLSHLPETMTKSDCMILVGSSFSEEMWSTHSTNGVITRDSLLKLYTARTDSITHGLDIITLKEGSTDNSDTTDMISSPVTAKTNGTVCPSSGGSDPSQLNEIAPATDNDSSYRDIPVYDDTIVSLTSPDGSSSYEGTCHEGKPHGKGRFTFKSGAFYEGQYYLGKKHGQGIYKYNSGAIYCGEWKDDKKHGQGVYRLPSGDEYRGFWEDNVKSGQGRYSYVSVDGGVYTGEWKHDKKHGMGTYEYINGDVYKGYWLVGKKNGSGVYTYSSGEQYDGDWNANLMHGHGKFSDASGKVAYEGEYKFGNIFNFASVTDPRSTGGGNI
mmetsp:Transcript_29648/g.54873  ORF Transcript_29648/g.54873 Transcript_29648/m.54873 type:complete len:330 (-) Transcript_29648:1262-2251(-)